MSQLADGYGRRISYLRISVTDSCNLMCQYCVPADKAQAACHGEALSLDDIVKIVQAGVELGVHSVRLTGGEPLARRGIVALVKELKQIAGLKDLSMTTNGVYLARYGDALKNAGLDRVNISLDSLDRERYARIVRRDQFVQAVEGIETALRVGLHPVKLNVVVMKGVNDDEALDFLRLTMHQPLHVRFIEFMPMGPVGELLESMYVPLSVIRLRLEEEVDLHPVNTFGRGPANYFQAPGACGTIGFITPISHSFCDNCDKLRITSDGKLRPCLASDLEIDLRDEAGELSIAGIKARLMKATGVKPYSHRWGSGAGLLGNDAACGKGMRQIGG